MAERYDVCRLPWQAVEKLLRHPFAASRARSLLAYLSDVSRRSLCGSLQSDVLATFFNSLLICCDLSIVNSGFSYPVLC